MKEEESNNQRWTGHGYGMVFATFYAQCKSDNCNSIEWWSLTINNLSFYLNMI